MVVLLIDCCMWFLGYNYSSCDNSFLVSCCFRFCFVCFVCFVIVSLRFVSFSFVLACFLLKSCPPLLCPKAVCVLPCLVKCFLGADRFQYSTVVLVSLFSIIHSGVVSLVHCFPSRPFYLSLDKQLSYVIFEM